MRSATLPCPATGRESVGSALRSGIAGTTPRRRPNSAGGLRLHATESTAPRLTSLAVKHLAAGGAEVAAIVRHAGGNALHVRDILVAEPHRIRLAGRALPRGPLPLRLLRGGGQRRKRQRETKERRNAQHRSQHRLCGAKTHYQPSGCGVLIRYF